VSDTEAIARFFHQYTGLVPQLVTGIRRGTRRQGPRLSVWSIMTEQGHFYVIQGKTREVLRATGTHRIEDLCRRYLELHPDEAVSPPD